MSFDFWLICEISSLFKNTWDKGDGFPRNLKTEIIEFGTNRIATWISGQFQLWKASDCTILIKFRSKYGFFRLKQRNTFANDTDNNNLINKKSWKTTWNGEMRSTAAWLEITLDQIPLVNLYDANWPFSKFRQLDWVHPKFWTSTL